jgi:ribonuclease VapC
VSDVVVLDASALLCLLKNERGSDQVISALPRATINAVNLSEVYAKLVDAGGSEQKIMKAVGALHLKVEPFDAEQARIASTLRLTTKAFDFSLGDRACLALAQQRRATALTANQAWADLPNKLGISIEVIR